MKTSRKESKAVEMPQNPPVVKMFKINGDDYLYDIKRMSAKRILQAITLFKLHQKMEMNMPATVEELKVMISKESESNAFAVMLMKVKLDEKKKVESIAKYDPYAMDNVDILDGIEGLESYNLLLECKNDFFRNTGLSLAASLTQLPDIMKQLNELKDKGMANKMLEAAVKLGDSSGKSAKTQKSTKNTKKNSAS